MYKVVDNLVVVVGLIGAGAILVTMIHSAFQGPPGAPATEAVSTERRPATSIGAPAPAASAGGLDAAQAAFEERERRPGSGYDFDLARQQKQFKCQNAPTLRICRLTPVIDGRFRDFSSFACSTSECAWVDP